LGSPMHRWLSEIIVDLATGMEGSESIANRE
jgi:hypothetical protein